MSHRPKPTAIKILEGNPGKRPLNKQEPKPDTGIPERPKGMGHIARREWSRMSVQLHKNGLLTVIDGQALKAYCLACEASELAYKDFSKNPYFVEPRLNKLDEPIMYVDPATQKFKTMMVKKINPSFTVYCAMEKQKKAFLIEFGMTPASRSRIHVENPAQEDGMSSLLNRSGVQFTAPADSTAQPGQTIAFDIGKAVADTDTSFITN